MSFSPSNQFSHGAESANIRYSIYPPPPPLLHSTVGTYLCCSILPCPDQCCHFTPHSLSPSLGAGLLWLVGTRARKSDIGRKQVHSCVLQEATKGLSNRTVASPTPNSSLCQWSLIHPDHPLPPPPDRAHLWQNWKEQNLCWKVRHRISPLSSHRPLQHPAPVIGEHLLLEMVQNSTEGSSYMTDIWLTTILPHKNHVKPNALTSLICPGSNQNIFLWQVHCLNRSNFFTKCKNRKVWASVPNLLVCQLIDCTVVDNLSKAKMSPIVTGVPWH